MSQNQPFKMLRWYVLTLCMSLFLHLVLWLPAQARPRSTVTLHGNFGGYPRPRHPLAAFFSEPSSLQVMTRMSSLRTGAQRPSRSLSWSCPALVRICASCFVLCLIQCCLHSSLLRSFLVPGSTHYPSLQLFKISIEIPSSWC